MIKKIIAGFFLFTGILASAQDATSSPYSFYGIGDIKFKGTIENRSMGGLSIFRDSTHINLQNPASLSDIKLTTFTFGGTTGFTKSSNTTQENNTNRTTVDYLALALPLGKFGVSLGLMPYSAVGYNITNSFPDVVNDGDILAKQYTGTGSVNKVFVGIGYAINKEFSVGVNLESNFGKITTNGVSFYKNIQYGTRELNTSAASGLSFSTGLMYQSKFKGKHQVFAAINYVPQTNLNFNNERTISRENYLTSDNFADASTTFSSQTSIKLPSKFSFGVGVGEVRKWQVGTEIVFQNSSNFGNRFNDLNNVSYENAMQYKLGGYYIPKYNSFTSYFQRVTYRGGFNYQNTGLVINSESIKEHSFSVGLGMPIGGFFTNLNLGFEIGSRGTTNAGLIMENYKNITIGLSINDRWFVKRKYD